MEFASDLSLLEPLMKQLTEQYGIPEELFLLLGGAILAFAFFILVYAIVAYVLGSIGLYTLAKNKGYANPWLAWIPFANSFLQAKVAFDNSMYGLIYLALVAVFLFFEIPFEPQISIIVGLIVTGFLFARFSTKNAVLIIINVITLNILSAFFIFAIRNNSDLISGKSNVIEQQ